ncbi:hypothetical protein EGM97_25355 [Pseudomonas sp. AF32]|uniref:hypothetical protein n=1 Tax=Pseudomonas sp. AF32 TaxID=554390 RepID=UPI001EEF468C|nr:hypothetical protein [Pseudomonas sp. AF32]MCG6578014.1 hypothetical protein [Pseudomonas sp. AF32]
MDRVITEAEIDQVDLKSYNSVFLVGNPEDRTGVEIFTWPKLAQLVHPSTAAPLTDTSQLLIVVDNPDDPDTVARIKSIVVPTR